MAGRKMGFYAKQCFWAVVCAVGSLALTVLLFYTAANPAS